MSVSEGAETLIPKVRVVGRRASRTSTRPHLHPPSAPPARHRARAHARRRARNTNTQQLNTPHRSSFILVMILVQGRPSPRFSHGARTHANTTHHRQVQWQHECQCAGHRCRLVSRHRIACRCARHILTIPQRPTEALISQRHRRARQVRSPRAQPSHHPQAAAPSAPIPHSPPPTLSALAGAPLASGPHQLAHPPTASRPPLSAAACPARLPRRRRGGPWPGAPASPPRRP